MFVLRSIKIGSGNGSGRDGFYLPAHVGYEGDEQQDEHHGDEHSCDCFAASLFAGELRGEREIGNGGEVVPHAPHAEGNDTYDDPKREVFADQHGDLGCDCHAKHTKN